VIYLDTSVALAQLLAEDRKPPAGLWAESLVSSRLLEYEVWTRIHARKLTASHGEAARTLLARVAFVELDRRVLARVLEPFPTPLATLDALHLASAEFLREHGQEVAMASYDRQMVRAARALGLAIQPLRG
jgi:predicted nucleic acid-binding protein